MGIPEYFIDECLSSADSDSSLFGSQGGVSNFTQWLAVHLAQEYSANIRVNALAPGFFMTEQNRFLLTDAQSGELTARGKTIIDQYAHGALWRAKGPGRRHVLAAIAGVRVCDRHCRTD